MGLMRRWRLFVSLVLLIVVAAVAWMGWQAWQVQRDLSAAVDSAKALRAAAGAGDDAAVQRELAALQESSESAADRTSGHTWSLLTHVPVFGDDATGVRLASETVADLSQDGIAPLTNLSQDLEGLVPRAGQIDVAGVKRLQEPVGVGQQAFAEAATKLGSQDSSGFVGQLRTSYDELEAELVEISAALDSAGTALEVLPGMLGAEERRSYLLVFQNNAEVRATGGLPGAVSVVAANNGKISLKRQVAANSFARTAQPVLELTESEEEIYGDVLGTFFVDANFTPDFPRTAALMKARWQLDYPKRIDGVISLDPVALSYILEATGPITVGEVSLTPANTVEELLHRVYLRFEAPNRQDAFFQRVARAVFDSVADGVANPETLIRALGRAASERRVLVHSFDATEQAEIGTSAVSGVLTVDGSESPQVGFFLNDATGAKMSYFLRYDVSVDATYCKDGEQGLVGKAQLLSDAPEDAASLPDYVTGAGLFGTEPGSQTVAIRIYGPVDGTLSGIEFNAEPLDIEPVIDNGRPVATLLAQLEPRQKVDLTWRMTSGPDQPGDVKVSATPGVQPETTWSTAASACA